MPLKNKLEFLLGVDTKDADKSLKKFSSGLGGIKTALGTAAGFFAAQEIIQFGKATFDLAAGAEEAESALRYTFPTVEGLQLRINDLSDVIVESRTETYRMVAELGNFWQALGQTEKHAIAMSEAQLKWAADIVSFKDIAGGVPEVMARLKSASVGNYEAMELLTGAMEDNMVRAHAMKLGFIDTTKQGLAPMTKAFAVFDLAMEQTVRGHGDLERTQFSARNQARLAQKQFKDLSEELSTNLLPTLTSGVSIANRFASGLNKIIGTSRHQGLSKSLQLVGSQIAKVSVDWQDFLLSTITGGDSKIHGWISDKLAESIAGITEETERLAKEEAERMQQLEEMEQQDYFNKMKKEIAEMVKFTQEQWETDQKVAAAKKKIAEEQKRISDWVSKTNERAQKSQSLAERFAKTMSGHLETTGDIQKDMARRVAKEMMDGESELSKKQIEELQKRFNISNKMIRDARDYLSKSDLERDLMHFQERMNEERDRTLNNLKEQKKELEKILQLELEMLKVVGQKNSIQGSSSSRTPSVASNNQRRSASNTRTSRTPLPRKPISKAHVRGPSWGPLGL